MRLKKWRSTKTNQIFVFVNDWKPDTDVSITDGGTDDWRVQVPNTSKRLLTAAEIQEIKDEVEELTGVHPGSGFKALCKEVDW